MAPELHHAIGLDLDRARNNAQTLSLVQDAVREVADLAQNAGANLWTSDVTRRKARFDAFSPESTASRQRDLAAGCLSELEEQNGVVVHLSQKHQISAKIHTTIYRGMTLLDGVADQCTAQDA